MPRGSGPRATQRSLRHPVSAGRQERVRKPWQLLASPSRGRWRRDLLGPREAVQAAGRERGIQRRRGRSPRPRVWSGPLDQLAGPDGHGGELGRWAPKEWGAL
ncbi:hypothetical protein NDU88_002844 [Pleurodeles waltl]|uniref:Uncharacterized protein n=1 Tax=Pleurodeles waltl TaxID=8319 RepID=A0AAV7M5E5_PLEWA|nr:hypothetical protein NDU88_002844 [Pleurodeles waltl]